MGKRGGSLVLLVFWICGLHLVLVSFGCHLSDAAEEASKSRDNNGSLPLVWLTALYCPTANSSAGAILTFDPNANQTEVVAKFQWPEALSTACNLVDFPTITFDSSSGTVYLAFFKNQVIAWVSLVDQSMNGYIQSPGLPLVENMVYLAQSDSLFLITPIECYDYLQGCVELGTVSLQDGSYSQMQQRLPFTGVVWDVNFFDSDSGILYLQLANDLRPDNETCLPPHIRDGNCLATLDVSTGQLSTSKFTPFDIGQFSNSGTASPIALLSSHEGHPCPLDPQIPIYFAIMDVANASVAEATACFPDIYVEEAWISSFTTDGKLYATATGNVPGGFPQMYVIDTSTGDVLVASSFPNVGEALGAYDEHFNVLSVNFLSSEGKV